MLASLIHGPLPLLIVQTMLIVAASRAIGLATRRIRQPMVIAEVVAGIALGPSLLGWLAPDVARTLFPAEGMPILSLLSQFGLVLFMFFVGLEFDRGLLRGRGSTAVVISLAGIVVPFALGVWLAQYLHAELAPAGVPIFSFGLFMGAAMSITAFPVLARILVERRLLRTKIGAMAITCAAVGDVSAWCILACVVSLVRASSLAEGAWTTALAGIYIALMLRVVRPLIERLAARSANKEGLSQNLVAGTMLLLLLSSWLTEMIGIHALFGAFIFGAIVPKDNHFAQILADKLEDLVVVLLLPLFFAYSGLRTEIGLLDSAQDWAVCAVVILVACIGKFGGSAIAARATGVRWRESAALGILMNTRGLMELIVLNIGLDLGVISPTLFTMMVIMALVTTFVTTPLLEAVYPSAAAADQPDVDVAPADGFTVLTCVAYDRSGPGMVTVAGALLGETDEQNRLYALRLLPPTGRASFVLAEQEETRASETSALGPLLERADALGLTVRPLSFVSPRPSADICEVAAVKRADLVIMGWHKPVLGRAVLSGTVHDVMGHADASVAVLVDRGLEWIGRVLVPFRGGPHDRGALTLGLRIARHVGAKVTVLHVLNLDPKAAGGADDAASTLADLHGETYANGGRIEVKKLDHAEPIHAVIEECETGYDLVVVGASADWGLEHRSFGMQPETIVRDCPASLLIVRQHERGFGDGIRPVALVREAAAGRIEARS
jgi:Kef-type K+ transport system membrane component KefB/nucleotide-binding universal stress UspA family protein